MYSKVDKLINAVEIKKFIDEKQKRYPNQYIKTVVYDDAEHVLLFLKHPDDYTKNINNHLIFSKIDMPTIFNGLNIETNKMLITIMKMIKVFLHDNRNKKVLPFR